MTTIAARAKVHSGRFLPFDEEEWANRRSRSRARVRSWVAWALLPALVALVAVGSIYAAQTAHATALTYEIAAVRAQNAQLQLEEAQVTQQLGQQESAGQVEQSAVRLGMSLPTGWVVVTPPPVTAGNPLMPVLVALRSSGR